MGYRRILSVDQLCAALDLDGLGHQTEFELHILAVSLPAGQHNPRVGGMLEAFFFDLDVVCT